MNADLAFCLERFIDDQVQLIDDYLDTARENEAAEYQRIQDMRLLAIEKRKNQMNSGPYKEDVEIVQRFINDFVEISGGDDTDVTSEVQRYREMMLSEFSAKLDDCVSHVMRLRNLARPTYRSGHFVKQCNETIHHLQREKTMTENYGKLNQIIDSSNQKNIANNVQHWWDDAYGSAMMKIIQLNKGFNPGVGNKEIAYIPPWSQPIDCARKIISAETPKMLVYSKRKYQIVYEFVRRIQSIDEENRREISENDLIYQLKIGDIEFAKNYAQNWLKKREESRIRKEHAHYDRLMEEAKVKFDRQRIAQESKKMALASLLRRLAVGSNNTDQFDQKLKRTLHNHRLNDGLPIITGDIGNPGVEKLPITIHLEQVDVNKWMKNTNKIQDKFIFALCQAFQIPKGSIRILRIECGSVLIRASVEPPYGKKVVDIFNGTASDSPARLNAVRECCLSVRGNVQSITVGRYGLLPDRKLMDSSMNKNYLRSKSDIGEGEFWEKSIDPGAKPYSCPSGWFRFGIKVAENNKEFQARWSKWDVAYLGTKSKYAIDILTSGLRMNTTGLYYDNDMSQIAVSPSIEYCAHRKYAEPWTKMETNGKTRWFQVVLQCRVNPRAVKLIRSETLLSQDYTKKVTIDPNFLNRELQWIIPGKENHYHMNQDIICCGLMMRVSEVDPEQLPTSSWWKHVQTEVPA